MILATDDVCFRHETGAHPECGERLAAILGELRRTRPAAFEARRRFSPATGDDVARVHDGALLDLVEAAAARAVERGATWLDPDTVVAAGSFTAALAAAGQAIGCARAVLGGEDHLAFAAVRPPGHHATRQRAMGFCLLNSIAAAARAVQADGAGRIAIIDFDVHHGNGTQDIFWEDGSVFYASLHRYPFYPGTGAASETGSGAGLGTTRNFPLPYSTRPREYHEALARAIDAAVVFRPDILLVSAGFDAYRDDPIGGLHLEVEDFERIGAALRQGADAACGGRVASVLEGGYDLGRLGACVDAYLRGLERGEPAREPAPVAT